MRKVFTLLCSVFFLFSCAEDLKEMSDETLSTSTTNQKSRHTSLKKTEEMVQFEKDIVKMQKEMNAKEKDVSLIASEFTEVLKNYLDVYGVSYSGYEGNELFKLALDIHYKEVNKLNQ